MRIGLLSPSIYMSSNRFRDMIFAPRDLAVSLADGLVARGHGVFFFTAPDVVSRATIVGGDTGLIDEGLIETKARGGGEERFRWASFYGRKKYYESELTARCFQMAREGKLDLVHSYHDSLAHFFDEATGFPVLYTLHDPLPTDPNDLTYWLLARYRDHRYVSISKAFQKHDTLRLNFVDTVYHGVQLDEFPFVAQPSGGLLFMGRLVPEKGLHDGIAAAIAAGMRLEIGTQFPKEHEDNPYFDQKIKPFLDHPLIAELGLVGEREKARLYSQAKAVLFPIHWEEPFGMVMIEAMACGTPVIAYNRGSVPEIVRDGVTGIIVPEERGVEGLVEAVKRIGEIDRAACRRHVEEHFTVEKMVAGYEAVYENILASKG